MAEYDPDPIKRAIARIGPENFTDAAASARQAKRMEEYRLYREVFPAETVGQKAIRDALIESGVLGVQEMSPAPPEDIWQQAEDELAARKNRSRRRYG